MDNLNTFMASAIIGSIAVEAFLNAKDNLGHYERKDTITNVGIATMGIVVNLFVKGAALSFFIWVSTFSFYNPGEGVISWIVLFLLIDFHHYLFHWLGHKSRFFWAMHVIHHSSPKFNLTTALRTPFTNSWFRFASMAPIVLMGFSPAYVLLIDSVILILTFFHHTELIGKLGWLEYIFNTPSHHRVHHGSDPKYLDKNLGAALIIWDKLFGTFQKEEEHPTYGLTKPLRSNTIVHVFTHEWIDILHDLRTSRKGWHRLMLVFGRPGWRPGCQQKPLRYRLNLLTLAKQLAISIMLTILISSYAFSQMTNELMTRGREAEKHYDDAAALAYYEAVTKTVPDNAEAFTHTSRMYSNLSGRQMDKTEKRIHASRAEKFAKKAIVLDSRSAEARLALIIAQGLLAESADSPSEKLRNAKLIREEVEFILSIDSLFAPAYFVLGKWHYELAKLSWLEKAACNVLFGGVPPGVSLEKSIQSYDKAIQLQPEFILFRYGKACALHHKEDYLGAMRELEKALMLAPVEPDDHTRIEKCKMLLKKSRALSREEFKKKE